jgi:hypothetical protein
MRVAVLEREGQWYIEAMLSDAKYARELIEAALKDNPTDPDALFGDTLYGALQHVYLMAQDRGLPWARAEVYELADDAIRHAEAVWLGGRMTGHNLNSARAVLHAAQQEGFDLRAIVLQYLRESVPG